MSGLKITNEITNLDGPGPPEVQTDFEPQGDTVLLATGDFYWLCRGPREGPPGPEGSCPVRSHPAGRGAGRAPYR